MDTKEITAYQCGKCNKSYMTKQAAESCCAVNKKVCEDCGVELDPKWYRTVCTDCLEKRRYNRCRKMTISEYEKEFPDNMVIRGDDSFYSSVQDCLECCYGDEESIPYYVYGTKKRAVEVDIGWAIQQAEEDAYEDAEFDNTNELFEFVSAWNERNRLWCFEEAKIVIDIPEELRQEYMNNGR
jgi:hypothetical protein